MIKRLLIFALLNFGALAIGGLFTGPGVSSDWYQNLNKAPWTPPGWVFGAAWTTIMICFTIFMANALPKIENKNMFLTLFAIQWVLNVAWNPVFFKFQNPFFGLILISTLTLLVGYFIIGYLSSVKLKSLLVLPYFVWLVVATSLNAFILFKN